MISLFLAAAAGAVQAPVATPPAQPARTTEKKVCRSEDVMGSFRKKRVCRTVTEWAAASGSQSEKDEKRDLEQIQTRRGVTR